MYNIDKTTSHTYDGPSEPFTRDEFGGSGFTAEASDIGLPPGFWPYRLHVAGWQSFVQRQVWVHNGEIEAVVYENEPSGITLRIVND